MAWVEIQFGGKDRPIRLYIEALQSTMILLQKGLINNTNNNANENIFYKQRKSIESLIKIY